MTGHKGETAENEGGGRNIKTLHHFHRFSGLLWASVGLPGECGEWNRARNIISQYNWHPAADSSPSPTVTLPLLATFSYSYNLTIKSYISHVKTFMNNELNFKFPLKRGHKSVISYLLGFGSLPLSTEV